MQPTKGIKKPEEIGKYAADSMILMRTFSTVIQSFRLTEVNKVLDKAKVKGLPGRNVFEVLSILNFIGIKNLNQLMQSGYASGLSKKKDVYYDFLRNQWVDWRLILHSFARQFVKISQSKGDQQALTSPQCMIVDDSLVPKTGKVIELIGKLYDHCSHRYELGLRMLTLGFWDGRSFIPLDFSIHNEPGKKKNRGLSPKELKAQYSKDRFEDSPGYKRQSEVAVDKIEMGVKMIREAVRKGFTPEYVLADSWFISERFIAEVQKIRTKYVKKLNVIGLMKANRILVIEGKNIKATLVPESRRKQIRYCRSLKCNYIAESVTYKGIVMKAFWIKMKGQQTWKMLISTDTNLGLETAMKYYQIRWSIETFFKETKQNLNLNGCQSKDFDAHLAHISLCFISYIVLALRKRFDDYETMGALFRGLKGELLEMNLVEKIWQLLIELYFTVLVELGVDWEVFIKSIINHQSKIENLMKIHFQFLLSDNKQVA